MSSNLDALVAKFEHAVLEQERSLAEADSRGANRAARECTRAFEDLRSFGDSGREALTRLLDHPEPGVRINAAACLLPYARERAMKVLRSAAREGSDLHALAAAECIKRWEEGGLWELDPPKAGAEPRPRACSELTENGDLYYDWIGDELRSMAVAHESPLVMASRVDRLLGGQISSATLIGYFSRAFHIPLGEVAILGEWKRFGGGGRLEDAEVEAALQSSIRAHESEWLAERAVT